MVKKGIPKRDGSGRGTRKNRGRGGCKTTKKQGKGRGRVEDNWRCVVDELVGTTQYI